VTVAGLLLAAGAGRRMGSPKALLQLDGRTLVERGVDLLRDAGCAPVVVVLGADAEKVRPHVDADIVVAPDWEEGLGASLRAGLAALATGPETACVVALVDQPLIGVEAVRRLIAVNGQSAAAVATYGGRPRNPVLLSRAIWPDVADLAHGDVGARMWLRTHPEQVRSVVCDDTGSAVDVDTPETLATVRDLLE
jgi:CTP:molybdopterin cytidylyltransferase MocA